MKEILLFLIRIYKSIFSPVLKTLFGHACKFTPTCSEYSKQAIQKYGATKGVQLSLKRIIKCSPLTKGGYDPLK